MAPAQAQRLHVERAFERLYRRHALDVYRYAMAVLRNQADAEDVTQTTFMNAYRALERGDSPTSPHNWLIAIAHNVCRQRFRAQSRRVHEVGFDEDIADRFVAPEDDDAPSPDDIRRALDHLAFNQRAALVMRELEGRSYVEIADLLGLSVSAVETLIFRARRALREQLEGTLTCGQAEQLLSKQLDVALAKAERAQLRAHLRECPTCRTYARSHRAQRRAIRALGALPLPQSLASLFGGTAPVAAKITAVVVTAGVAGGVGYDVHRQLVPPAKTQEHQEHAAHHVAPVSKTPVVKTPIVARAQVETPAPEPAAKRAVRAKPTVVHHAPAAPARVVAHGRAKQHPTRTRPAHPADRVKPAHPGEQTPATRHGEGRGQAKSHGKPVDLLGNSGQKRAQQGHGKKAALLPQATDVPVVTTVDGITHTSQKGGARKPGERHLHP